MENYEEKIAVLEKCVAGTPDAGTEEYNLINGPLDVFKNYIAGVIENEQNSNNSYDEQSKKALENMYSLVHSSDSNISSHDRVEICKTIATIIGYKKGLAETTTKETTKRMGMTFLTTALLMVGKLVEQYLNQMNKPWWKKMFG